MKNVIVLIALLVGSLINCKAQTDSKIVNSNTLERDIDTLVKQYQDLDIFSGIVLVAERGALKYHKAFGLANREANIPNTLNTKFDIGSMNKSFTKLLVLQLLESDKLNTTDKLGHYLDGFPDEAANKITITDLLNHSSGYTDYWGSDFDELSIDEKRLQGLVERIKKLRLEFEPGTDSAYSNAGYVLLGAIIEKITGKTYHQNVIDRIIEPLGLTETYVVDKSEVPDRAIGYYKDMKGRLSSNTGFLEVPNPDGGFQSTPRDVQKFYNEYFYGTNLLSAATKTNDAFFGFINENKTTGGAIPMAGGFPGANTSYHEVLRDEISIIVFANMDEPVAENLGEGILAMIRGKEAVEPALPAIQSVYNAYKEHGLTYVETHFKELITNFHPTDPKSFILNDMGYQFLEEDSRREALEFFQLNAKLFPEDANVWDSLGEGYLVNGDRVKALINYKKALELDPYMESAKEKVEELSE